MVVLLGAFQEMLNSFCVSFNTAGIEPRFAHSLKFLEKKRGKQLPPPFRLTFLHQEKTLTRFSAIGIQIIRESGLPLDAC